MAERSSNARALRADHARLQDDVAAAVRTSEDAVTAFQTADFSNRTHTAPTTAVGLRSERYTMDPA